MVSLLALPLVIMHNVKDGAGDRTVGGIVLVIAVAAVAWAWWQSKRETAVAKEVGEAMAGDGQG
jgi:K(+)-stimulated pyrophosphate-energized sodium pump